jgi:hypothetical protein
VIKYLTVEDLGERRECEEELRKLGLSEGDLEQLKAYAKAIMDEYYRERAAEMRERLCGEGGGGACSCRGLSAPTASAH